MLGEVGEGKRGKGRGGREEGGGKMGKWRGGGERGSVKGMEDGEKG